MGILSTERPLPLDRVHLLNPGQSLDVGRPRAAGLPATAVRQPVHHGVPGDGHRRGLTSDCFGAPLPTAELAVADDVRAVPAEDRKSTRLNSSHANISYAVFCLKKKKTL